VQCQFVLIFADEGVINRWLSVIGIFLMVFGGYGVFVVRDEIKALDKLVKKSESTLAVIKTHSKNEVLSTFSCMFLMVSDCRSNLCSNVNNCCDTFLLAISAVPVCFDFRR
jgi:flagellar motor component MotA